MKRLPTGDDDYLPQQIQLKHIKEITALDERAFGANRMQLIEYLIKQYPCKAYLLNQNNNIIGFALGRDGNKYHHIGPVIAPTIRDAQILISKALRQLNNQLVVVDILNDKNELMKWLESLEFTKQREFIRMYCKENPFQGTLNNQYLICGPDFG
jgi:hypothetical protein